MTVSEQDRFMPDKEAGCVVATWLLLALIFLYACLRAYVLSLTHDEALTYIYFARLPKSYWDLINYQIPTSNNHLLNSILIKFFTDRLGNSEWIIRLPTLIGQFLFLIGTYLTLRLFLRGTMLFVGACLIILHPFLIDYFSCARGYGLGLGFFSWGFFLLLKKLDTSSRSRGLVYSISAFIALSFATLSNLSFFNVFVGAAASLILFELRDVWNLSVKTVTKIKMWVLNVSVPLLPNVLFLWLVYRVPIQKLIRAKEIYYGGNEGFWENTVSSLIQATFHGKTGLPRPALFVIMLIVALFLCISFAGLIRQFIRRSEGKRSERFLGFTLLIQLTSGFAMVAQHALTGTVFPYDRAAIFFIPLFTFLVLLLWSHVAESRSERSRFLIRSIFEGSTILVVLFFILRVNVTHFHLNRPDAHTKDMMKLIEEMTRPKRMPPASLRIGVHWWFEPAVNYYIIKNSLGWIHFVDRSGLNATFDYYYMREDDKDTIGKLNLHVIKKYDVCDTYLAAPQKPAV